MPKPTFVVQADAERIIIQQGACQIVVPLEQAPVLISDLAHALIGAARARLDREVILQLGLTQLPGGNGQDPGS